MSLSQGPLQTVPVTIKEETQKKPETLAVVPSPPMPSEFELKLREGQKASSQSPAPKETKLLLRRRPGIQPPMRRLAEDAQPLSSIDRSTYNHLLPHS